MSFSEQVKKEILNNTQGNYNEKYLSAEKFGEFLTQTSLKYVLEKKYGEYFDIAKLEEKCITTILKGMFLSTGCIVDPELDYHFEVVFKNKACANYIYDLLSLLEFTPKIIKRKKLDSYVVYFKESDQIATFLSMINATNSYLKFEQIRVEKEVKNTINRTINCETANLTKTINRSVREMNAINKLKKYGKYANLDEKLKYAASLRQKYQDKSLAYIASKTNGENKLTKSGLKHRLDKIVQIAEKLNKNI